MNKMIQQFENADFILWIDYGSDGWSYIDCMPNGNPILNISDALKMAAERCYGNNFVVTRKSKYEINLIPNE